MVLTVLVGVQSRVILTEVSVCQLGCSLLQAPRLDPKQQLVSGQQVLQKPQG